MRTTGLTGLALVALLIAGACRAQSAAPTAAGSPEWVVEQFYARPSFPDRGKHVMGELAGEQAAMPTIGQQLSPAARVSSHAVQRDSASAVFATAVRDTNGAMDFYTYLRRRDGAWKIYAIRTLALPGLFYMARDELRKTRPLPDSLARELRNIELTAQTDSALKAYFLAHRAAFDEIANAFAATGLHLVTSDAAGKDPRLSPIAAKLRALDLNAVERDDEIGSCVLVNVGGMTDNSVGFLGTSAECSAPEMDPTHYIYVEPLAPGWYIYKTT